MLLHIQYVFTQLSKYVHNLQEKDIIKKKVGISSQPSNLKKRNVHLLLLQKNFNIEIKAQGCK